MPSTSDPLALLQGLAFVLHAGCQAGLVFYSAHRWPMLIGGAERSARPEPWWPASQAPRVLVQLPVRDEPAVVERLVAAAAALDWPRDRLEVQLLDDSGEAAAALGATAVARARVSGVNVLHVRRAHRSGFKAGALAAGLELSAAEFVAVFDADFVPPPDFLRRMLPHFGAARVGLVQARWEHLNREASLLTRAQAVMLDAHFLVEHGWRQRTGQFINFNGTAGVWRRDCIESAGGWSHDTLTEDLDLSYRAQLAGWRFVFDPEVRVPAELPESMRAFRSQQYRWAKGALQTARKLLPRVWSAPLPLTVKFGAFLHLTASVIYPLLLAVATLLALVLNGEHGLSLPWWLGLQLAVLAGGTLPVALFLARGQQLAGQRGPRAMLDVVAALLLCGGLAWYLACAVVGGLWGSRGEFVRTPKTGDHSPPGRRASSEVRRPAAGRAGLPELALAGAFTLVAAWAIAAGQPAVASFPLVLSAGLLWVGAATRRALPLS